MSASHAADRLLARVESTGSIACVGLDPRPDLIPAALAAPYRGRGASGVAAAFLDVNRRVIDAIADSCPVVKPQAACYEAYGAAGWETLAATIAHARDAGLLVILDAKRGDIGSTATHYGQMAFGSAPDLDGSCVGGIGADWMTVNGYLGRDGIEPVLDAGAGSGGVFVLVKTSNPSSGDLQDRSLHPGTDLSPDSTVADAAADLVAELGSDRIGASGFSDVGAVVGATYPDHARRLRARMPDSVFLVPGYGAQGADAAQALAGVRADGRGVLVSSSRGITGAWQAEGTDDVAGAARRALDAMNADLASAAS